MYVYDYLLRTDKRMSQPVHKTTTHASLLSKVFAWLQPMYSSATDENPLKTTRQLFVHGRIPSQKHQASIRPWTNTISKTWGKYSSMDEYLTHNHGASIRTVAECPLISYCGRIPCQERGAGIRPWMNSTFSTNGFPECSSNLFVFVRGVKSCCRCTGCPDFMLLWCRCELLEREASV